MMGGGGLGGVYNKISKPARSALCRMMRDAAGKNSNGYISLHGKPSPLQCMSVYTEAPQPSKAGQSLAAQGDARELEGGCRRKREQALYGYTEGWVAWSRRVEKGYLKSILWFQSNS